MLKLAAVTMSVIGVGLCVSPTASAARVDFEDKEGDAKARFDITRVIFVNSADAFLVKSRFEDLSAKGTQIFGISLALKDVDGSYAASTVRRANGTVTAELWRYDGDGGSPVDCNVRARWRPGKDVVRLRLPQGCLAQQGRVAASAYVGAGDGSAGEPNDWTRTVNVRFD